MLNNFSFISRHQLRKVSLWMLPNIGLKLYLFNNSNRNICASSQSFSEFWNNPKEMMSSFHDDLMWKFQKVQSSPDFDHLCCHYSPVQHHKLNSLEQFQRQETQLDAPERTTGFCATWTLPERLLDLKASHGLDPAQRVTPSLSCMWATDWTQTWAESSWRHLFWSPGVGLTLTVKCSWL